MSTTPINLVELPNNAMVAHNHMWAIYEKNSSGQYVVVSPTKSVPINTPLYAVAGWDAPRPVNPPTTYTVTFNSEGGSTWPPETCNAGQSVLTDLLPVRSGYTFTGWFTAPTGGSQVTSPFTPTGNVTLYAQWNAIVTPPPTTKTLIGTYSGAGQAQAVTDNQTYLGLNAREIQLQFLDTRQSWANGMTSSWYINQCAGSTKAIMSIPMLVGPTVGNPGSSGTGQSISPQDPSGANNPTLMTLADVGASKWDALYTKVFQAIAAVRPDCILRIGWEMYGSGAFFNWSGPALSADHKSAYINLVKCARAVSPKFQFEWNGALIYDGYNPMISSWPGAEYVDFITADVYEGLAGSGATGWARLAQELAPGMAFAKDQGKLWGTAEFGLWPTDNGGSGDDPAWIQAAYDWFKSNESYIAYILYFNNPGSSMSLQQCPNSAAVFKQTFGAWARGT